ncbi:MAG: hypothetical protein RLZZ15_3053, partial [Verrucomicrobiota bacterium]
PAPPSPPDSPPPLRDPLFLFALSPMKKLNRDLLPKLVHDGDLPAVRKLLAEANPPLTKAELDRALAGALGRGKNYGPIMRLLLERGANPEQRTSLGPVLQWVAQNDALPQVKALIDFGADPNRRHGKETALSAALGEGESATVAYLERLGAQIDPSLELLYAAKHGNLPRAKRALAAGGDIEVMGGTPRATPLIAAATSGHADLVEFLLAQGARPQKKRGASYAFYTGAAYGENPRVIELLVEAGVSPDTAYEGKTALMGAAQNGDLAMVRKLVELGANPNVVDKERGMTALDSARAGKHKEVCGFLADLGVAAARDAGRNLARALKRAFGARCVEHSSGFLLNAKFAGHRSQLRVDPSDAAVAVFGLKHISSEFRGQHLPSITIGVGKPTIPGDDARMRFAVAASKATGLDVYASLLPTDELQSRLTLFCRRLKTVFETLSLEQGEFLHFSRDFAAFVWRGTEIDRALARLRLFAALVEAIARPPQPERRLFEREWLLRPAPKAPAARATDPVHRFGGPADPAVLCAGCGAPIAPIVELDLRDPQLPAGVLARAPVTVRWCLECGEWDPIFHSLAARETSAPAAVVVADATTATAASSEEADAAPTLPARRLTLVPVAPGKKAGRKSKLGGAPSWIQSDGTPDCRTCEKPMAFLLQLNSDAHVSYGDVGMLYAFACPECRLLATVVQSH